MMRTIGRLLRQVRASESASPLADPELAAEKSISVTNPSFGDGEAIPRLHADPVWARMSRLGCTGARCLPKRVISSC